MGENESRYRSGTEHMSIELRMEQEMGDFIELPVVNAFLTVQLGSFKVTIKMVYADL